MITKTATSLLATIVGLGAIGTIPPVRAAELILHFSGVEPGKGPIKIEILDETRADQFLDSTNTSGAKLVSVPADQPPYSVKVEVPNGRYAVSAFQDQRRLGKIDLSGPYGRPAEPWGISNNAKPAMRAPEFADAAFTVGDGVTVKTIDLGM
jgi:uncharacterized protein (DUF2141 family)